MMELDYEISKALEMGMGVRTILWLSGVSEEKFYGKGEEK